MSTAANYITNAIAGLGTMDRNIRRNRLEDAALEDSMLKMTRQEEKDLVAKIEGQGNYRLDDPSGAYNTFDFYRIAQERPDLASEVLNSDPRFNIALDEKNNRIQTKVSGFEIDQDDGSVIITVTRPDGRKVPLTENRTAQNNDAVVRLSKEDFQKIGQNTLRDMGSMGAMGNDQTFRRDAENLRRVMVKEVTLDKVVESPVYQDPGAASNLAKIVTVAEPEEREEIAKDMGVDIAQVETSVIDEMEASGKYSEALIAKARKDGIRSISEFGVKRDARGRPRNSADANIQRKAKRLAKLEARIAQTKKYRENLNERRAAAGKAPFDFTDDPRDGLPAQMAEAEELRKELGAEASETETPEKAPDTKPNEMETQGSGVAKKTKDAAGLAKTIRDPKAEPTQQDLEATGQVLAQYQVREKQDLVKLPSKELHQVAFMMASRQGGTVQDKLKVAQEIINYGMTGDRENSAVDLAKLGIDRGNLNLRKAEFIKGLEDEYKQLQDDWNDAYKDAIGDLFEIKNAAYDENNKAKKPTNEQTQRVSKIWTKAKAFRGVERRAYQHYALEATMVHMNQIFDHGNTGIFEWSDKFDNWFNDDSVPRVGNNSYSALLRATIDPKNPNKAIAFFFRDPNGGVINFPMSPERFKDQYGAGVLASIEKLAIVNTRNQARADAEKSGGS